MTLYSIYIYMVYEIRSLFTQNSCMHTLRGIEGPCFGISEENNEVCRPYAAKKPLNYMCSLFQLFERKDTSLVDVIVFILSTSSNLTNHIDLLLTKLTSQFNLKYLQYFSSIHKRVMHMLIL